MRAIRSGSGGARCAASGARRSLFVRVCRSLTAVILAAHLAPLTALTALTAQAPADTMAFYKALDLESAGKYKDAVPLFRLALRTPAGVNALLGLERVLAELGQSDSLVGTVDTLIASNPREETYRTVQLRTLESLGRDAATRAASDRWDGALPGSPA